nr:NADH dehydrogenase subunit 4 [Hoplopleura pacifica]
MAVSVASISSIWSFWSLCSDQVIVVSSLMFVDSLSNLLIWGLIWVSLMVTLVPSGGFTSYVALSLVISALFYSSPNWVGFFVWFEVSMLPMFMMIMSHSVSPERLAASRFLFMYTILASFPLLLYVLDLGNSSYSLSIWVSISAELKTEGSLSVLAWMSFMVKLPLFLVHLWLLKAHVEAPMVGSMFLAGVLLKFGGIGVARLLSLGNHTPGLTAAIIGCSLWGSALTAVMAMVSSDVKAVVAYASVSHMNVSLAWGMMNSFQGMSGFMLSMIAHSFSSSLLFYSVTRSYEKVGSRSIIMLKGVLSHSPICYFLGVVVWAMNMNVPPFMGLWGEVVGFLVIVKLSFILIVTLLMYFAFSSCYSATMYVIQFHLKSVRPKYYSIPLEYVIQHLVCSVPMIASLAMVMVMDIS